MKKNKKLFAILTLVAFMMSLVPALAFATGEVPAASAPDVEYVEEGTIDLTAAENAVIYEVTATNDTYVKAKDAPAIEERVVADNKAYVALAAAYTEKLEEISANSVLVVTEDVVNEAAKNTNEYKAVADAAEDYKKNKTLDNAEALVAADKAMTDNYMRNVFAKDEADKADLVADAAQTIAKAGSSVNNTNSKVATVDQNV